MRLLLGRVHSVLRSEQTSWRGALLSSYSTTVPSRPRSCAEEPHQGRSSKRQRLHAVKQPAAEAVWADRLLAATKAARQRQQQPIAQEYVPDEGEDEDDVGPGPDKRLPNELRFFDTARISVRSGDGGSGCVAFRREKFVEKGGPSGGNGGRGGNVWAVVDEGINSLSSFRHKVHWRASNGTPGQGSQLHGADGADIVIPVPSGTIIRRRDAEENSPPLAELIKTGDKALLMVGGRGGRGNESFKTHKNTAPAFAEKGEPGSEVWLELELKVVADVGIVGVPNAGKSTLLASVTAARPKIANYPFTTLVPNLGVCEQDYRTCVLADVPGLLEGAHEGLGLGTTFLRHLSRCRLLLHVIDGTSPDPVGDFNAVNLELQLFSEDLADKPQIIAYNKMDLPDSSDYWDMVRQELLQLGVPEDRMFAISAATKQGVREVLRRTMRELSDMGPAPATYETNALNLSVPPRGRTAARIDDFVIDVFDSDDAPRAPEDETPRPRTFAVRGEALEKFVAMSNWDYYEALKRFQRILEVAGINAALKARGVREGDTVEIAGSEFTWSDDQSEGALFKAWLDDVKAQGKVARGSARWPKAG